MNLCQTEDEINMSYNMFFIMNFCLESTILTCNHNFVIYLGQQIEGNCEHLKSVGFLLQTFMFVKTSLLKMYENMPYNMFYMCTFLFIGTIII